MSSPTFKAESKKRASLSAAAPHWVMVAGRFSKTLTPFWSVHVGDMEVEPKMPAASSSSR
jgi:hypothetical protein